MSRTADGATRLGDPNRFPDENPNPVMRIGLDGVLAYANPASRPIVEFFELEPGRSFPAERTAEFRAAAADHRALNVTCGLQTYSILPVHAADLDYITLYGTDVTARKVVDLFPDRNPYPVMRMTGDGVLTYANPASRPIADAMGFAVGKRLPSELLNRLRESFEAGEGEPVELTGGGRVFALHCVPIPELGFTNIYGADVTAARAITKFPDQNPHPVIRVDASGTILYANPASEPVVRSLGVTVGERIRRDLSDRIAEMSRAGTSATLECEWEGRLYSLIAVPVYEYGFTNLYGTDITANREVDRASAENDRLLLNILPASIAERLRKGETLIADRVDEMTVLFADIVDFSQLSMSLDAAELVRLLNGFFSTFDDLTDEHGLEKIKTIGDAYMVVGGLAPSSDNHCGRVADVGLAMLAATEQYRGETGVDIHIRVGMHMGPAVAGVVGIKKFIYDVWGETVNTASRMESHGIPDRVQATDRTYRRLRDRYAFDDRGFVNVRGRGPMRTWLLTGPRTGS